MLLVAAAIFILGIFVLGRERANEVAVAFVALTTTVSLWLMATALMAGATTETTALVLARFSYVGIALMPAAVLQFTMALLNVMKQNLRSVVMAWIVGVIFADLFVGTRIFLAGTWQYSWGFYPRLTDANALFLAYFAVVLASALFPLATTAARSERERRRNRAFFVALSVASIGSIDYLPSLGIDVHPIGWLAILGFIVLVARSVFRYSLRDLTPPFVADRLLQTMHGGVIVVDTPGRVRVANDVAAQLLGWSVEEMEQLDLPSLLSIKHLPATDSETFGRQSVTRHRLVNWRRRDGSEIELSLSASALRDEEGNILGVLYAISDVSDRRRAEANEFHATHDLLTSLPNRARFAALFEESKPRILAAGRIPAVLFIDLDGFKAVNDEHGHFGGDALLQMLTKRLRNAVRGEDVLARYAGDEFVLCVNLAHEDHAALVASKLLRVINEPYAIDGHQVTISASIGAAMYPKDGPTVDDLIRSADSAMYAAKRAGKGRVHLAARDIETPPPYRVDATA